MRPSHGTEKRGLRRRLLKATGRWTYRYFFAVGVAVHLAIAGAVLYALDYYQVTLPQLALKAVDRYDIRAHWLVSLLAPAPAFPDYVTDGMVRRVHPADQGEQTTPRAISRGGPAATRTTVRYGRLPACGNLLDRYG